MRGAVGGIIKSLAEPPANTNEPKKTMDVDKNIVQYIDCGSASELIEAIRLRGKHLWKLKTPSRWLFRGQANAEWKLLPSALREDAFVEIFSVDSRFRQPKQQLTQIIAERNVISHFLDIADARGLQIPDDSMAFRTWFGNYGITLKRGSTRLPVDLWIPRNMFAVAAIVRHAELPTRLLDWTTSPMKAAYFAAADAVRKLAIGRLDSSKKLAVWAVDRSRFSSRETEAGSIFDGRVEVPVEFFGVPRAANPNAHAQDGYFSISRQSPDLTGEPYKETLTEHFKFLSEPLEEPVFKCFNLPIIEAAQLLFYLAIDGISAATVFPDFAGVALSVRDRAYYDRSEDRESTN